MNKNIKDENTKEKILSTATKLFSQKGFDGVGVREICKEADVNVCMISYYFGGKKELYQAIIDSLITKQNDYAKNFMDYKTDLSKMSKNELIDFLHLVVDKIIDYMFTNVSKELLAFLIAEQQKQHAIVNPPTLKFVKKIIAKIFDKDENDKDIIFKVLFLIGNIITPRVLLHFSLEILKEEDFTREDIEIIKENAHLYIKSITKGVNID